FVAELVLLFHSFLKGFAHDVPFREQSHKQSQNCLLWHQIGCIIRQKNANPYTLFYPLDNKTAQPPTKHFRKLCLRHRQTKPFPVLDKSIHFEQKFLSKFRYSCQKQIQKNRPKFFLPQTILWFAFQKLFARQVVLVVALFQSSVRFRLQTSLAKER